MFASTTVMLMDPLDVTLELSPREDCPLTRVTRLILEIGLNDHAVYKINLLSRQFNPGVWHADQILVWFVFGLTECEYLLT
jgi:hypothetical protein